ncbi:hypothetical protein LINPERHAP1_LOCUS15992, partial [Linum perenne]
TSPKGKGRRRTGEETAGAATSPTATRFQARLNRLPLQDGKVKERDKDE